MPLTPLIGVSVLVHIVVIIVGKILRKDQTVYYSFVEPSKLTYVAGCAIILSIFGFVLMTAGLLLKASVEDSHSTLHYVSQSAQWIEEEFIAATPKASAAAHTAANAFVDSVSFDTSSTTAATLALVVLVVLLIPHRKLHTMAGAPTRVITFWYISVFGLGMLCVLFGAYNVLSYIAGRL